MNMKKRLALLLSALLLMGTAMPAAAAEEGADARLTQVTQSVKETLQLDTEGYSTFQGEYGENELAPVWYLYWNGEAGYLSVTALEDGTVVDYSRNDAQTSSSSAQGLPAFPKGDPKQATAAAQAFLDQVLTPGLETVTLEEPSGLDSLNSTTYRFSGTIQLRGLPSPLNYSVTVRAADNVVTRFWRDVPATSFLGDIPSAQAKAAQADAAQALQTTLSLRLEYLLPDGESTTAVLCYLPDPGHTFYVDAQTGKLIDVTALEEDMYKGAMGAGQESGASASDSATNGLSQAEQEGIQQLEGVLSKEELDQALRAVPEYGLSQYELVSAYFSLGEKDEDGVAPVTCTLRYSRAGEGGVYARTFTMDARTGQLERLTSSIPWDEEFKQTLDEKQALAKAQAFLQSYYGERCSHLALYETPGQEAVPLNSEESVSFYSFRFARQENGYFFPAHYYTVRIDTTDGSVCGFYYHYDESITFEDPQGIISADQALQTWMDTYQVTLGYRLVPEKLDGSDAVSQRLLQMGLSSYYHLKLTYALEREESYRGILAKSGEPLSYKSAQPGGEEGLAYTDLDGHWAQSNIQRLAQFNVGYAGGSFQPNKTLTQWDLVCLLYSLNRAPIDPSQASTTQRDDVYAVAYEMGVLTRAERNDEAGVTRGQLVKYLLDGAGYGAVAQLEGIFTCAYSDRASIPAEELGYAALAQGFGMVSGSYSRTAAATRAQAANMLCRLMER